MALEIDLQPGGGTFSFSRFDPKLVPKPALKSMCPKSHTLPSLESLPWWIPAFCYCIDLYNIVAPCTRLLSQVESCSIRWVSPPGQAVFENLELKKDIFTRFATLSSGWRPGAEALWKESHDSTLEVSSFQWFNGLLWEKKLVLTLCMRFHLLFTLRSIPHPASKPPKKGTPNFYEIYMAHQGWNLGTEYYTKNYWHLLDVSVI